MNFIGDERDVGSFVPAERYEGVGFTERLADLGRKVEPFTPVGIAKSVGLDVYEHPGEFPRLFSAAERQTRLVDTITSQQSAIEEAYDRRIKTVKEATGLALDNPERMRLSERELRRLSADGPIDPVAWKRQQFEQKLADARAANPDKTDALTFGSIDDEARALAKGAEDEYEAARRDTKLGTASSLLTQAAGGFVGSLRDPLFTGSLFAGPTGAIGRTVGARILTGGLIQGLYNAGLSAIEQPSVQAWRADIGAKSGVMPAIENVGMAFLFGAIPGAALTGVHEIAAGERAAVQRVLAGQASPGDIDAVMKVARAALGEIDKEIPGLGAKGEAAVRLGEEMDDAARVTRPPPSRDVSPELHDDLTAAALRHGDDPSAPSPQAVAAVHAIEAYHGSPHDFDAFDISKIGTGEGAQSYGHGLYFAENQDVAKSYSEMGEKWLINGQPLDLNNPQHRALQLLDQYKGRPHLAVEEARAMVARDPDDFNKAVLRSVESRKDLPTIEKVKAGAMYRVRIKANREHMLDWDKPLSEQSAFVKDALQKVIKNPVEGDPTGEQFIKMQGWGQIQQEQVSKILREAGIPGIKYLDQGSRAPDLPVAMVSRLEDIFQRKRELRGAPEDAMTPQALAEFERLHAEEMKIRNEDAPAFREASATRNFVIFDDKLVEITHKNDRAVSPVPAEVEQRIAQAQPRTQREAQQAASEALEDIGNRQTNARIAEELQRDRLPEPPPLAEGEKPPRPSKDEPLDQIPWTDAKGRPDTISPRQVARIGERETFLVDLMRECK